MKPKEAIVELNSKSLSPFIDHIRIYNFGDSFSETLYPKGAFELVFQNHQNFQHDTSYTQDWEQRPCAFLGGLHHQHYDIRSETSNNSCFAIQFKPNAIKHFLKEKLNLFQNELIPLDNLWGKQGVLLEEQLYNESNTEKKVALIETFLLNKYNPKSKNTIDFIVEKIHEHKGFIEVRQLSSWSNLSDAQFRKRFNEEIGISPIRYCKIQRCKFICELLSTQNNQSLTSLAYKLGYCDQSHFIKEFKSIIGISPKKFVQNLQISETYNFNYTR